MDFLLVIINLFSAEKFLKDFFQARDKILTQARLGKQSFFLFQYPVLGWVQYNNHSIESVYSLAKKKSPYELIKIHKNINFTNQQRIHAIASYLLQKEEDILKLFNATLRARNNSQIAKNAKLYYKNPFPELFNIDGDIFTGEELMKLQNYGHKKNFIPFISLENNDSIQFNNNNNEELECSITIDM